MKKTLLITGGSGLLGLNWALSAREEYDVTLGLHKQGVKLSGVRSRQISLESKNSIISELELLQPAVVIHTVGLTSVEQCEADPDLAHHINVSLAENVAGACFQKKIPMVHISTDHLFSGSSQMVSENQSPEPVNIYAKTKAEAEHRVLDAFSEALIIRTNFFGWGHKYRKSFSDWVINSLRNKEKIGMFDDVYFTPILISRLVQVCQLLVEREYSGIYNVVGDERLSKYKFGCLVADCFGFSRQLIRKGCLKEVKLPVKRPYDMSLDNSKIKRIYGRDLGSITGYLEILKKQEQDGRHEELLAAV